MKNELFLKQVQAIIEDEEDLIANLSNISALLNEYLDDLNWVGFYLHKNNELVLGPFQGRVACTHIPFGKGVCGTSASKDEVIRVVNVHEFEGHIACDSASNSEIVLPVHKQGKLLGVLDIDSPRIARFTQEDEDFLKKVITVIEVYL